MLRGPRSAVAWIADARRVPELRILSPECAMQLQPAE